MNEGAAGDRRLVEYLLGNLTAPERDRFEEEYFAADALHEQLLQAETDLIDSYLNDELDARPRELFETRYLASPARRRKLDFARALRSQSAVSPAPAWWQPLRAWFWPARPSLRLGWVAAALAVVVIAISTLHRPSPVPTTASVPRPEPSKPILTFVLMSLQRSSGAENRFTLPPGEAILRLVLPVEHPGAIPLVAAMETVEGRLVRRFPDLKVVTVDKAGPAVTLDCPSTELPPGDYLVRVETQAPAGQSESVAGFSFRVLAKR